MRTSTGLIQFFLCIDSCKLCYVDTELGNLTFEMVVHSSLLAKSSVASSQLAQFVLAFSGQAESVVPSAFTQEIAILIAGHGVVEASYSRLNTEIVAKLLIRTFQVLRDEAIREAILI